MSKIIKNGKNLDVYIDYDRCVKVVKTMNEYFKNKSELAPIQYPSNVKYKTHEYFIYMFYSCLLDYGMRSKIYHQNLINTYIKYPYIFSPKSVVIMNEDSLKHIIVNNIHPRYPNVATKKWIELSKELVKYDNLLEYLMGVVSFTELNNFIKSIKGYGQKTGGLLIRIIYDSKVCNFNELESIPIDRHDIEISYLTGIINNKKISNCDINKLSDTYVKVGNELNINSSDIDKYLWEVGNLFCNKKECNECPLSSCSKK